MLMFIYLFFREREKEHKWERARERESEGYTESEVGSRLQAISTEPNVGLEPTNHKIMT